MTILWIGLAVVVAVALGALLIDRDTPKTGVVERVAPYTAGSGTSSTSGFTVLGSSNPVQVEHAEAVSVQKKPTPRPPSKPAATKQTVLAIVAAAPEPIPARAVAAQLRATTPAKVSSILVGLRRDGKVKSKQQRNLQLWYVA